jgi:hypothetical protein
MYLPSPKEKKMGFLGACYNTSLAKSNLYSLLSLPPIFAYINTPSLIMGTSVVIGPSVDTFFISHIFRIEIFLI